MATKHRLTARPFGRVPSADDMKFGIVVSEWNPEITEELLRGAVQALKVCGCADHNIVIKYVPGSVELTLGAHFFAQYTDVDAVIVLGCVIRGETAHFDYVCQSVTQGITDLMVSWNMPIAFGVLTTENMQQALDRAGGKLGNKGEECALTAIKMVKLQIDMEDASEPVPGTVS